MNAIEKQLQLEPNRRMSYIMTIGIVCLLFIWSVTTIHFENVSVNGTKIAKNIFVGLLNPDWSLIINWTTAGIPYLLIETMAIAFLGTIVGALLAIPLAFCRLLILCRSLLLLLYDCY